MNDVERALLKACHMAIIALRARASLATPAEVSKVTDAVELVLIELWNGRATENHLLLESELASIVGSCPEYPGESLFALSPAGELDRQRTLFEQSLVRWFGPLPDWAQDRIRKAGHEELADYGDLFFEAMKQQSRDLTHVLH